MKTGFNIREDLGVTPIVSATLVMFIVVGAIGSVFVFGIPYVDELHKMEILKNAELQLSSLVGDIGNLINYDQGGHTTTGFAVENGFFSIDEAEYDRTIVMYSYTGDPNYNFTMSWSDDDTWFQLDMASDVSHAIVYWLDERGVIDHHEQLDADGLKFYAPGEYPFTCTVNVSLFSNSYESGDEPFGSIWLFDSNSLTYTLPSSMGAKELIMEKGGMVYSDSEVIRVKKPFGFYAKEDVLKIGIVQTLAAASSSTGGNGFRIQINTNSYGSYVREDRVVYYFKLQFHNGSALAWLDYFSSNYDFIESSDGVTLFYTPSDGGVRLVSFLHSIVELSIS